MIVYLKTISQGEIWFNAQYVHNNYGGGHTNIKVLREKEQRFYFWDSIVELQIDGVLIIKDGERKEK